MTTMSVEERWFVVQTQPHAEMKAASHLLRQQFNTYVPRYLKRRRHARRIETVAAPLFPRYIFIAINLASQPWRCIQSTIGVARLVCNGDTPAAVPANVVESIKRRENDGGFVCLDRPRFAAGDAIRVVDGVFSNCLGLFEGMGDKERVTILLDLLGRKVRVVVDGLSVEAA
jgi:transcriptional antiterminator RfaH